MFTLATTPETITKKVLTAKFRNRVATKDFRYSRLSNIFGCNLTHFYWRCELVTFNANRQ